MSKTENDMDRWRLGFEANESQHAFNIVEVTGYAKAPYWPGHQKFNMNLNHIRCLLFVFTVSCLGTSVEAQVTYSLCDDSISSAVPQSAPVRRMSRRVRPNHGRIIPTFDRSGRFNREAAYRYNEGRPLAGLFAPDFELTASVFGGWNRIVDEDFGGDDIFDDDFAVGFAYGRRHNERLRSEFEFTYRSNESSAEIIGLAIPAPLLGEVQVLSIMKNFVIDVEAPCSLARPYFGIGIGYAHVETDFNRNSGIAVGNSSNFAWQPIGGVSMQLTEKLFYFVEYRYFSTTDLDVTQFGDSLGEVTYSAHNLFMGLRCEF